MAKIALIGCSKRKRCGTHPARELYTGSLFKKSLAYAQTKLKADAVFVLSALYGLVPLNKKITCYNVSLTTMPAAERRAWAEKLLKSLSKAASLEKDTFVILAGKKYYEYLRPHIPQAKLPLKDMPNGKQLQWLNKQLA